MLSGLSLHSTELSIVNCIIVEPDIYKQEVCINKVFSNKQLDAFSESLLEIDKKIANCVISLSWLNVKEKRLYSTKYSFEEARLICERDKNCDYEIEFVLLNNGTLLLYYKTVNLVKIIDFVRDIPSVEASDQSYPLVPFLNIDEISLVEDEKDKDKTAIMHFLSQFIFRYQVNFEDWNEVEGKWQTYGAEQTAIIPKFNYIEESLFDGTHNKLHDGELMKFHKAGKPKQVAIKWLVNKSAFIAYFWFDEAKISNNFYRCYGHHPDTKTDFIIRIDAFKKKCELSLYRFGMSEPLIIPESAYQLIVFKSGFEYFRSENYNQPAGAWIW